MLEGDGKVTISRVEGEDPLLSKFLSFLANDIKRQPEHIKSINPVLMARAKSLVADIKIDLDAPLSKKDE